TADYADHDQHGNSVSDTLICYPLAQPHAEHGAGDQDNDRTEIEKEPRPQDSFRIDRSLDIAVRLKASDDDRKYAGVLIQLPASRLTFFLHLLKRRKSYGEQLHDDRCRDIRHDPQCKNGGPVERAAKERIDQIEDTAGGTRIEQIRIDAWKDDIRTQSENNQVAECIQDPYPKVFDRENILYGGKEPLHYFTVVTVPPAASIALTAVAENAWASTLSFFLSSPLPRIFTRSFLPTMPLSTSV